MPKDSCVAHIKGYYLELRRDYVDLFDGDHCAAALAAFFEWATNNELARSRMSEQSRDPWVKVSMPKIFDETLGLYSISSLQRGIDFLGQNAILLIEAKSGTVSRYLFNVTLVSNLLSSRFVFQKSNNPGNFTGVENVLTPVKPSVKLPGYPGKTIGKITGVEDCYKEVSSISNNLKSITPIVPLSENSQEERLTPDVEHNIHLVDVDEIEIPDGGSKSKDQMSSSEVRKFWNHWKRVGGPEMNTQRKSYAKGWLVKVRHDDAITALNGYSCTGGVQSFDEFKSRFGEWKRAGMSQGRSESVPFLKTTQTSGHTSPEAPEASNAQQGAIATWGELVPSNPLDPPWDWSRDNVADLLKATQDPIFIERLPEICAKAEALAQTGNKSRDFRWMIKSFGKKAGNWWDFLSQKEAPRFKSKETVEETNRKVMERFGIK